MAIIHTYPQTDGHYTHVPWGKKSPVPHWAHVTKQFQKSVSLLLHCHTQPYSVGVGYEINGGREVPRYPDSS